MADRNVNVASETTTPATETQISVVPATTETPRRRRTTEKSRNITELCEANPANMSKAEAVKYIKYLRNLSEEQAVKIEALKGNASSAYQKAQYYAKAAENIVEEHNKEITLIMSSLRNLMTAAENSDIIARMSINSILKGGLSE